MEGGLGGDYKPPKTLVEPSQVREADVYKLKNWERNVFLKKPHGRLAPSLTIEGSFGRSIDQPRGRGDLNGQLDGTHTKGQTTRI